MLLAAPPLLPQAEYVGGAGGMGLVTAGTTYVSKHLIKYNINRYNQEE